MQIFIKAITGKLITLEVEPTDTILSIKQQLDKEHGIGLSPSQRLVLSSRMTALQDEKTLEDYEIAKETTIHLVGTFCSRRNSAGTPNE